MKPGSSKAVGISKNSKASHKLRKPPKRELAKVKRNWLELPRDVMIQIFLKLGVIDILFTAQRVCSSWRSLSKEPQLFRCIDMRNPWHTFSDPGDFDGYDKIAREALSRNCGDLVEFSMEYFGTDELIDIAISKSKSSLRSLRLVSCYQVSDEKLIEIVRRNPSLEELELCLCSFEAETIGVVGKLSLQLISFRLNQQGGKLSELNVEEDDDELGLNDEAFAIANNMPQLRRLHLFGNMMKNIGLQSILEKCPYLEYLDLRQCFSLDLKGDLQKKCVERILDLRLPNDSTHDYEFDASVAGEGRNLFDNYESEYHYYGF